MKNIVKLLRNCCTLYNMPYYAVARGRQTGIFLDWPTCQRHVHGFYGARYKKFKTEIEAEIFLEHNDPNYKKKISIEASDSDSENDDDNKAEDFWPSDQSSRSDDNDILLAASYEVEGIPTKSAPKRKQDDNYMGESSTSNSKVMKHDSVIYLPSGQKKIKNFFFPMDEEGYILCYTDGSCESNGQRNPVAGFGVYFADNHPLNTAKPVTGRATNNVGEIQAAIYAIKIAKDCGIKKLRINTDSQFLISSITQWVKNWKRNNWMLSGGGVVKNADEFKELDSLLTNTDINVKWNHVKGHQGIIGNEMADRLARQGAEMYRKLHYNK